MADRGLCAVCGGDYAVAQDGTPYKHASVDADPCPGADQPIVANVGDAVYRVYGGPVTEYRFVVLGPFSKDEEHPEQYAFGEDSLPLLGTPTGNSAADVNPLLPEGERMPEPPAEE